MIPVEKTGSIPGTDTKTFGAPMYLLCNEYNK